MAGEKFFQRTGEFARRDFSLLADFQFASRPAHATGELGYVRGMVASMPVIEDDRLFDGLTAIFRVGIAALPVLLVERAKEPHPASMQRVQQVQRMGDSPAPSIFELGPTVFLIRKNQRPVFRQSMAYPVVGIHVAVGD